MSILGEAESVIRADNGDLEVAQQGVDRLEAGLSYAGRAAAVDLALVFGTDDGSSAEAPYSIGDDGGRWGDEVGGEDSEFLLGMAMLARVCCDRPAVGRGLERRDQGHRVLRAAAGLAARQFAAEVGIVDLHWPSEFTAILAQAHRLHDLVLSRPSASEAHCRFGSSVRVPRQSG